MIRFMILLFLLFSSSVYAIQLSARTQINLPDDCAYLAHDAEFETPADICANTLQALQTSFEKSKVARICDASEEDGWPALNLVAQGAPVEANRLKFVTLTPGKFLIIARCTSAAYNANYLFFFYDETTQKPQRREIAQHPAPPLIMFPTDPKVTAKDQHWNLERYRSRIGYRDFAVTTATVYEFIKAMGGGYAGYYARYQFDQADFLPRIQLAIMKTDTSDHQDGYHFNRNSEPKGKKWVRYETDKTIKGCFTTLEEMRCVEEKK